MIVRPGRPDEVWAVRHVVLRATGGDPDLDALRDELTREPLAVAEDEEGQLAGCAFGRAGSGDGPRVVAIKDDLARPGLEDELRAEWSRVAALRAG